MSAFLYQLIFMYMYFLPFFRPTFQNQSVVRQLTLFQFFLFFHLIFHQYIFAGSIVAVTTSEPNLGTRQNRFVGICIRRERPGLLHQFTLRNVIDGLGVEVMYELYNPTILKIETLKLEKRLDNDLSYLVDALPEYSTFNFNMEPMAHPIGTPVPVNDLKVS